jgi:hypothetical protein
MSPETHPIVSRAVGYAAGRYGHVLFPQNVHEPALDLAKLLVDGPGKGWADRVFFSDNGSTAVEVGIKMGFHKYMMDHGLLSKTEEELEKEKFLVLALDGSYHGDTLGAMNAQSPSVFTGKKQFAWYRPFGHFVEPPTLALVKGEWKLELPEWVGAVEGKWRTREEAFDVHARKGTPLADAYRKHIKESIGAAEAGGARVGTLLMECGFHGAGETDYSTSQRCTRARPLFHLLPVSSSLMCGRASLQLPVHGLANLSHRTLRLLFPSLTRLAFVSQRGHVYHRPPLPAPPGRRVLLAEDPRGDGRDL